MGILQCLTEGLQGVGKETSEDIGYHRDQGNNPGSAYTAPMLDKRRATKDPRIAAEAN